jgi:hypothetical protein
VSIPLLILATGCSPRARNQYAQDLVSAIDKIYANLDEYRKNSSGTGKPAGPVDPEINRNGVRTTGSEVAHQARADAEAVGTSLQKLMDSLETISFQVFMDVTDEKGYEKWATATNKVLREKADKCLELVSQIKREYGKNPNSTVPKSAVWLTPKDELVFPSALNKGLMIEHILRQDFRARLDAIHRRQIKQ